MSAMTTETLAADIAPSNATNKNVSWSSSNEAVATVSGGIVTGRAYGTATITVATLDGNKTDACAVTVVGGNTIAAGNNHTVAIKADGTLWAWGHGVQGQLGIGLSGTGTVRYSPVQVGTDKDWAAVATGGSHTVALKADGSLWEWRNQSTPSQVGTDRNWTAVASSALLKVDGSLWEWEGDSPVQVGTDKDWVASCTRSLNDTHHTVALKADGRLYAWGYNSSGQLGNNTTNSSDVPVQVAATGFRVPVK